MTDLNPQSKQMADESMVRNLAAKARAIWPQEAPLIRRYALPSEPRILDAGCGTGEAASRLAELFPQARVLGATDLKPEQSRNYSGGLVLNPVGSLDITADFYRIDIDDRVILTDNFTGAKIAALLAPFAANSARFFSNAIDTSTKGVDLIANYVRSSPEAGVLRLQAALQPHQNPRHASVRHAAAARWFREHAFRRSVTAALHVWPANGQHPVD